MEIIRESIDRISKRCAGFRGLCWGYREGRYGKTSALLEVIHEDHNGEATVYCMNYAMALYAKQMYRDNFHGEPVPNFVSQAEKVRGRSDPIFADEWWNIPTDERRELVGTGRLAVRIGQEFNQRNLDSTVLRFTDAETGLP